MTDAEIQEKLANYKFYHIIPLNERISTPGVPAFARLHSPIFRQMDKMDFSGKRVLDIGCRDGLFSFTAEKKGASEIIGVDNCLSLGAVEFLIPFLNSKVQMKEMGLFDLREETFGKFDAVLFLGVLYHLRYPFEALNILAGLCVDGGQFLLETGIYADTDERALLFCPIGEESPYEPSSVTFFNRKGMVDTLKSFGLVVEEVDYVTEEDRKQTDGRVVRGTFRCRKQDSLRLDFPHHYWGGGKHRTWQKTQS
jgi:SAM-dependent methyltransferase